MLTDTHMHILCTIKLECVVCLYGKSFKTDKFDIMLKLQVLKFVSRCGILSLSLSLSSVRTHAHTHIHTVECCKSVHFEHMLPIHTVVSKCKLFITLDEVSNKL